MTLPKQKRRIDPASSVVELSSLISDDKSASSEDEKCPVDEPAQEASVSEQANRCKGRHALMITSFFFALSLLMIVFFVGLTSNTSIESNIATFKHSKDVVPIFPESSVWMKLRWRPNDGPNNCNPLFQLANSTVHCGVGNFEPPITSDSDGNEYCGGVPMKPNLCVLPISGTWTSITSIEPEPHPHGRFGISNNSDSNKTRCNSMESLINGTHDENGNWITYSSCYVIPLSPFAWTEHASCETTITMIGDSHVRNLFTATVNGLRGISYFAEAHGNQAMKSQGVAESYEWRLDYDGVAKDRVGIFSGTKANPPEFFDLCPCDKIQRCLRILFLWAPTFNDQLSQFHMVPNNTALLIVEPGNAYEQTNILDDTWTSKIDAMLQQNQRMDLNVFHFIWGKQPNGRLEALTNWTTHGTLADRKSYLRQDQINFSGKQGLATYHFSCGLSQTDVVSDTIAAVEPCTDITDTGQIRAIVTAHFDALGRGQ